jgi:hypothetical protein
VIRFNPLLKGFFGRLVATGKPEMRAVGAWRREQATGPCRVQGSS